MDLLWKFFPTTQIPFVGLREGDHFGQQFHLKARGSIEGLIIVLS